MGCAAYGMKLHRYYEAVPEELTEQGDMGSLTPAAAAFLDASVQARLNILVSGATQSGKTTMLRVLCGAIPAGQRIITCEEVFELALRNCDCVAMQTRAASIEGVGEE